MAAEHCLGAEVGFGCLPVIPLANILSYLNHKDLSRCCCVSRVFSEIGSSISSWKIWCETVWLLDVSEPLPNKEWKVIYISQHNKWGKYITCYTAIRKAWNQIEEFTKAHCPDIYASLNLGLSDEELDRIMKRHLEGLTLPLDVQCSYQIHNGQRLVSPGLIGSMAISNHYQSESLLDLSVASSGLQHREGLQNCLLLSLCIYTGNGQFIALTDEEGHTPGEIFWPSPDRTIITDDNEVANVKMHKFHSACSFTDWITEYAERLSQNYYPVINKEIFKFEYAASATTNGITVKTTTAFLPELSSVHPPLFFFTYRISISMDKNQCSVSNKCQLTTRHWYITDGDGEKTEVHGAGVVGQHPTMQPGAVHEYVSCTTFQTPTGTMEGYYVFKYCSLSKENDTFCVEIPAMHFKSLPYIEADVRLNKIGRKQDEN